MGSLTLPSWMQSFAHPDASATEFDAADLGTVLGLEISLMPQEPAAAPRSRRALAESTTDFGDLPRD